MSPRDGLQPPGSDYQAAGPSAGRAGSQACGADVRPGKPGLAAVEQESTEVTRGTPGILVVHGGEDINLGRIRSEVIDCRRCQRLVHWRESAADHSPRRFAGQSYWSRPVPGFGDPQARLALVGLAPAAHGGNRTGRMFTGDRSGDWLYGALYRLGLASLATSIAVDDGLILTGAYVTAAVKCAPPSNQPQPDERRACAPYLAAELAALSKLKVIVALGAFAWHATLLALALSGLSLPRPRPGFGHGHVVSVGRYGICGCFHPSQRNTFTGKLTEPMLDAVLRVAWDLT